MQPQMGKFIRWSLPFTKGSIISLRHKQWGWLLIASVSHTPASHFITYIQTLAPWPQQGHFVRGKSGTPGEALTQVGITMFGNRTWHFTAAHQNFPHTSFTSLEEETVSHFGRMTAALLFETEITRFLPSFVGICDCLFQPEYQNNCFYISVLFVNTRIRVCYSLFPLNNFYSTPRLKWKS